MKRLLYTLVVLMILAVGFTAEAQTDGAEKIVADIPFAFNVGQVKLPAGKYTFMVLNPASDRKILQIRSMKKGRSAIVHASIVTTKVSDDTKLVFRRYGDRYFFDQAQVAGGSTALAAVMSKAERAEKEAVAAGRKFDLVSIIVN